MSVMGLSRSRRVAAIVSGTLAVALVAGCGGKDKPSYCSGGEDLQSDVKGLTDAAPSGGVSGLKTQLQKIQADVQTVVSDAKSDFPDQTAALKSSVDALETSIKALPSSPQASDIGPLVAQAAAVVSAVKSFASSIKDACD